MLPKICDKNISELELGDKVLLFGKIGIVSHDCGAYGIYFKESVDWALIESKIPEITGCSKSPCFFYDKYFVSFRELMHNFNCCIEDVCDIVEKIKEITMWTMEELLSMKTPFLSMDDITDNDWQILDFQLEKYDRANEVYNLGECKVLAFVLQQIHFNKANLIKIPSFIRNGRQFQELAVRYNPELARILFPTRE